MNALAVTQRMALLPQVSAVQYYHRQMRRMILAPEQPVDNPSVVVWRGYGIRRHLGGTSMPSDPTMSHWAGTFRGQQIGAWGSALNQSGAAQQVNAPRIVTPRPTIGSMFGPGDNEEV